MPTVLRALIIDDEAPARDLLWALLADHPNVKVVGEANCATAAASLYADLRPEVVFLDVHMPNGDGFSLLPKLQPMPAVIFVTAYDRFAVRAFEVNAVDYLLKPIRSDRLADALQRIFHRPRPLQMGPYSLRRSNLSPLRLKNAPRLRCSDYRNRSRWELYTHPSRRRIFYFYPAGNNRVGNLVAQTILSPSRPLAYRAPPGREEDCN